jgi:hypothetical protein
MPVADGFKPSNLLWVFNRSTHSAIAVGKPIFQAHVTLLPKALSQIVLDLA